MDLRWLARGSLAELFDAEGVALRLKHMARQKAQQQQVMARAQNM